MPFEFPLETLLNYRGSILEQETTRLRLWNQKLVSVKRELTDLDKYSEALVERRLAEIEQKVSGAELHFETQCEAMVESRKKALLEEVTRLIKLRDMQYLTYKAARAAHEVLLSLRNAKLHQYKVEANRREQRTLDDLFLMTKRKSPMR